jgi:phospholipase/carboxylesterase
MSVSSPELDTVEIEPRGECRSCVIWLHGLGADGHDFEPIVDALDLPATHGVRFVLPHAPLRPITINGGAVMRGWYDIISLASQEIEDERGIRDSARAITALIAREVDRGVPERHIILAGFSQGGAIALHAGLRHPIPLGGTIALSTYLPLAGSLSAEKSSANHGLAIMMAHGTHDDIIPLALGRRSRDCLLAQGYDVAWHEYPMGHAVCPAEITTIANWLRDRLS